MSEKMIQYNILKREAEANKTLYDSLETKLKEAQISSGFKSSNIRIVDPAMIPSAPSRPAKTRNIALAFLVGLVGGIGLALLREYLDNTVKTPDDVETLARLPSLAVVPALRRGGLGEEASRIFQGSFDQWPREAHRTGCPTPAQIADVRSLPCASNSLASVAAGSSAAGHSGD